MVVTNNSYLTPAATLSHPFPNAAQPPTQPVLVDRIGHLPGAEHRIYQSQHPQPVFHSLESRSRASTVRRYGAANCVYWQPLRTSADYHTAQWHPATVPRYVLGAKSERHQYTELDRRQSLRRAAAQQHLTQWQHGRAIVIAPAISSVH